MGRAEGGSLFCKLGVDLNGIEEYIYVENEPLVSYSLLQVDSCMGFHMKVK